jgi:hypothetical protein
MPRQNVTVVDDSATALIVDDYQVHTALLQAQRRMKAHADKNRSERQFAVGDQVLLKLQPYAQQ